MTAQAEREAIWTVFNTGWGSTTPVSRPNEAFSPPAGYWARMTIRAGEAFPMELGGSPFTQRRHPGVILVSVFGPIGKGNGQALTYAQQAAEVFTAAKVSNFTGGAVRYLTPTVRDVGPDPEGAYYHVQASIPYWRDAVY